MRPGGMTGYDAPIEYDREAKGYFYSDPTYSIRNGPLVSDDAPVLRQALAMLQQFQGLGLSEELGDIVQHHRGDLIYREICNLDGFRHFHGGRF